MSKDKGVKVKNKNRIINYLFYIELLVLLLLIIACICGNIFFYNFQRIKVLYYLKSEKISELTIEECVKIFGEPIYIYNDNSIQFDGGSICKGGFLLVKYEYILYVMPEEDGIYVESAYDSCVNERTY